MKTKNRKAKTFVCCALTLGLLAGGLATPAHAGNKDKQAKLAAKAKISKADAEKIALAQVSNGTVKDAELEKEHGKLIWSFDIATPGSADITEVQVNAKTGKVESVEKETPAHTQPKIHRTPGTACAHPPTSNFRPNFAPCTNRGAWFDCLVSRTPTQHSFT